MESDRAGAQCAPEKELLEQHGEWFFLGLFLGGLLGFCVGVIAGLIGVPTRRAKGFGTIVAVISAYSALFIRREHINIPDESSYLYLMGPGWSPVCGISVGMLSFNLSFHLFHCLCYSLNRGFLCVFRR